MSYDANSQYTPDPRPRRKRWPIWTGAALLAATAGIIGAVAASGGSTPPSAASTAPPAATATATPTAEQIAKRMHLPAPVFGYTATTDPNGLLGRDGEYTSKVNWGAATSDDSDNSIEVFPTPADAAARLAYLGDFKPPFGDGYDRQHGAALLRLSSDVTPAQAKVLTTAFDQAAS